MNNYYFTSDLHLSHASLLRGYRGSYFDSVEKHNEVITNNLLAIPRGSNLVIAGDLFWKMNSESIKIFFDKFQKKKINLYIIYGNHDKLNWFNHKVIKSQGYMKSIAVEGQSITISHYNMSVWNKSHYSAWLLYGHTHKNDSTWKKAEELDIIDTYFHGKKLNINIELHDFKPWSFQQIKAYMDTRENNWDFIDKRKEI